MLSVLTFPDTPWRIPSLVVLGLLCAVVVVSYIRTPAAGKRWPAALLKIAGLILLTICVIEPRWTSQRAKPGSNLVAVLADNSERLNLTDAGEPASRASGLRDLLDPARVGWQATLAETFDVRRYTFDSRLQPAGEFTAMKFDGQVTALGPALESLAGRFRSRPLAGVVVFTDGVTAGGVLPDDLSGLPPVFPVIIGGKGPERDTALQKVTVTQTAFEDAPVTIVAEIAAFGCEGETLTVRLSGADGAVVEEQTLTAPASGKPAAARLQVKPDKPGLTFYKLELIPASGRPAGSPDEATMANNRRVIVVDRGAGPYRVLYVSGRPNWEYKFLSRALVPDAQVQLVGLIRVAKREPKFDFRGRAGESGNPLFRGFDDQSRETAGTYDKPVLVRLNTRDETELRAGFPSTPEELFGYHAIILDDLEAAFFTTDQAALIDKFVSVRGGGLLMLGGMESFSEGGWARTPVGDLLPVSLERAREEPGGAVKPVKMDLDKEGWLQPWARLRDTEVAERARLDGMPAFTVMNPVREVKPAASVIATAKDESGASAPALVVQRFGRGRSAALMVGDVWRWGTRSEEAHADMDKAWRQLVRWLVSDVPGRVSLTASPEKGDARGTQHLETRVRDAAWLPVDSSAVTVEAGPALVLGPDKADAAAKLSGAPSLEEAGRSDAAYVPRAAGGYRATAVAVNGEGAEDGRAETGWTHDPAAEHYRSLVPDRALLEELARRTGGRVLEPADLDNWARELPAESAPVMETYSQPLWHTPWLFLLAIFCLAGEWGWRRLHGMP